MTAERKLAIGSEGSISKGIQDGICAEMSLELALWRKCGPQIRVANKQVGSFYVGSKLLVE